MPPIEHTPAGREALAQRNLRMARVLHAPSARTLLRRTLLALMRSLPRIGPAGRAWAARAAPRPRIVLIKPDHIGDVLLITPAVRALRRAVPRAEIIALVNPVSAPILTDNPDIDYVLTVDYPGFSRTPAKNSALAPYQHALATAESVRRLNATHALILRPDHGWGAWVAERAGVPVRIGFDLPDTRAYLTRAVPHRPAHAVEQAHQLVVALVHEMAAARFGVPAAIPGIESEPLHLPISPADHADAAHLLERHGLPADARFIAIQPGAGAVIKRWETARWASTAERLAHELDAAVVFTGGPGEADLIAAIMADMHSETEPPVAAISLAGETDFGALAAVYARARVVLGADSGPMHIAVATGTPTVTLYGPADPAEFGPWGSPERHRAVFTDIACRPCRILDWAGDDPAFHPCVRDISVGRVLEAARMAMNAPATAP